jgi:hypothetical protein
MWFHNSKKVTIDWIVFDSKMEWDFYLDNKNNKSIVKCLLQPVYLLQPADKKKWLQKITYVADFELTYKDWSIEVIDVKWLATETSKIKRKLFLYKYDLPLKWVCKYKWERVDYFENIKRRKKNKLIFDKN